MVKKCSKCKIEKDISEFHKQKAGKFGVDSMCKSCKKDKYKKTYKPSGNIGRPRGKSLPLKTKEDFIFDAKKIHGEKYDYSKVEYNYSSDKVLVICPEHGEFYQRAADHIRGIGCKICNNRDKYNPNKLTQEEFIERANKTHFEFYDYSKVNYINDNVKVTIICPKHGEFKQTPGSHVRGKNGCPNCHSSRGEREVEYILSNNNIKYEKEKRFDGLILKRRLPVDFFLPTHNIVIEYDGKQHFKPVRFNGISQEVADELFERTKMVDKLKDEFCGKNNIKLIRISYKEDINKKLKDLLWL